MYIPTKEPLKTPIVSERFGSLENSIDFVAIDTCVLGVRQMRVDGAIKWNRSQEKKGWAPYIRQIEGFLNLATPSDEETFARALAYWQCRENLVKGSSLSVDGAIGRGTWAKMWPQIVAPLLEKNRKDIPLDFLLGWIAVESDGYFAKKPTSLGERGYFQIHPGEWADMKWDPKLLEDLSSDPEFSVWAGIQLVEYYAGRVAKLGFTRGTELFWRTTKLMHSMGWPKTEKIIKNLRKQGVALTWKTISRRAPARWAKNVNRVFEQGKKLAVQVAMP